MGDTEIEKEIIVITEPLSSQVYPVQCYFSITDMLFNIILFKILFSIIDILF